MLDVRVSFKQLIFRNQILITDQHLNPREHACCDISIIKLNLELAMVHLNPREHMCCDISIIKLSRSTLFCLELLDDTVAP